MPLPRTTWHQIRMHEPSQEELHELRANIDAYLSANFKDEAAPSRVDDVLTWMSREGLDFGEIHMSGQACIEEVHQAFNDLLYTARQKYGTPPDRFRALDYLESRAKTGVRWSDDYRPPTWEEDQQQQRRDNLADELFPDSAKEKK